MGENYAMLTLYYNTNLLDKFISCVMTRIMNNYWTDQSSKSA